MATANTPKLERGEMYSYYIASLYQKELKYLC